LNGPRFWLTRNSGAIFAFVLFVAMFVIYIVKNGVGLRMGLVMAVANKGVLLALVAIAQTLPVLTGGLDLSVGMTFVLTNCLASALLNGPPWMIALGVIAVMLTGVICGAINGALIVYGRLQPIIATLATSAIFYGLALTIRPIPGGTIDPVVSILTTQLFGVIPTSLVVLLAVVLIVWVPFQLDDRPQLLRRRLLGIGRTHDRHQHPAIPPHSLYPLRPARVARRPPPHSQDPFGRRERLQRRHLHAELDRRGRDRRYIADGRHRRGDRLDLRRLRPPQR
jgi:hypothetical protein